MWACGYGGEPIPRFLETELVIPEKPEIRLATGFSSLESANSPKIAEVGSDAPKS
jgi:hypothetical protein